MLIAIQLLSAQQQFPLMGLLISALMLLPWLKQDEFKICPYEEGKGHSVLYQPSCQALHGDLKRHTQYQSECVFREIDRILFH